MATTKFDWYSQKALLRCKLNNCICSGMTYEETKKALYEQFNNACTTCICCTLNTCVCDKGRNCFIEMAVERYLEVAKEKCHKEKSEENK